MSVYKREGRSTYNYDFQHRGIRYEGNTRATSRRQAEIVERQLKDEVAKKHKTTRSHFMSFEVACGRYWNEVGQHHAGADTTLTDLERLMKRIDKGKDITTIGNDDVARLVAQRRGDGVANGTVNKSCTKLLRALLNRANDTWSIETKRINWRKHILPEPQERVRELSAEEEEKLFAQIRPDYADFFAFAILSGCRLAELTNLTWSKIDWRNKSMTITGKGDRTRIIPLTSVMIALLKRQPRAAMHVFTYQIQRGRHKGDRQPITHSGVKMLWRRMRKDLDLDDFRFHDLRHTAATRLLRKTGNLRLAKKMLGHASIDTTMKYAHVTDDDLRQGMEETHKSIHNVKK